MNNPIKDTILFVDDDAYFAYKYEEALRLCFDVITCRDAASAVTHLRNTPSIVAAVIDVMMPSPLGQEAETRGGFSTGIWIVTEAQVEIKTRAVALAFFTNKAEFTLGEVEFLEFNPEIVCTLRKMDCRAKELPSKIQALIARRHSMKTPTSTAPLS